jgi:hypothetical protein
MSIVTVSQRKIRDGGRAIRRAWMACSVYPQDTQTIVENSVGSLMIRLADDTISIIDNG